jgi:hypothetical protein
MTLAPTHIALEGFLVWAGMGKNNRELFKKHRGVFTLLTLSAIIPDLDVFFYIHRTYLNSLVWYVGLIIAVLGWLSFRKYVQKKQEPLGEKGQLIWRSLILIGVFCILHIILDLNPGPVLLFYPFDNRMYSWNVTMVWDLDSVFLLKEINFDWTSVSFNEGLNTYFLNLTPQERIEYFGSEFVEIFVNEFPIHLLTFLAWLVFFPGLFFVNWLQKFNRPKNFFAKIKKFKNPLLAAGFLLLVGGLILGPAFRLHRVEERAMTNQLSFTQEEVLYGAIQSFGLDGNDALSVQGAFAGNTSNVDIGIAIANNSQFSDLNSNLSTIFDQYTNNSLSYSNLTSAYRSTVQMFLANALNSTLLEPNTTKAISYSLPQKTTLYSIILIAEWNSSAELFVQTQLIATLSIERVQEFYTGIGIAIVGFTTMMVPLSLTSRDLIQEAKKEEKDEAEGKTVTTTTEERSADKPTD